MTRKSLFLLLLCSCALLLCAGCGALRFPPSQAQKKIAFQGHLTARRIEAEGTDAHSPAAKQQVQSSQAALTYIGMPKDPVIDDFDTVVAAAQADAAKRPDANDVFAAVEGGLSIAESLAALFGVGGVAIGGRSLAKWISILRSKSKGMEQIVGGNEQFLKWMQAQGKAAEVAAFKYYQSLSQKGKTAELVATARVPLKGLKTTPPPITATTEEFELEKIAEPSLPKPVS